MELIGLVIISFALVLPTAALAQAVTPATLLGPWATTDTGTVTRKDSVTHKNVEEKQTTTLTINLAADSTYTFTYTNGNGKVDRKGTGRWHMAGDTIFDVFGQASKFTLQGEQLSLVMVDTVKRKTADTTAPKTAADTAQQTAAKKPTMVLTRATASKP